MKVGLCVSMSLRLLVVTLTWSTPALAQDGTVEQLVAMALDRSPEIRAARTTIAAAEGALTQAALRPNPLVSGSGMAGARHEILAGVEWPLDLFRRSARVAVGQQSVETTTLSVANEERILAARVREQAGRVLAARRNVDITTEALTAARRMRELLDSRATEGGIPKVDANIAAVEAGRIEASLALAQADADAAAIELKALAGLRPDEPLVLRDSLEGLARVDPAPAAADVPAAIASRADIREATARIALADAKIEQTRSEARTDVTLLANYGHERYTFAQQGFNAGGALVPIEGSFPSLTFGAAVTLPFRNRNQGAIAAAQAERSGEQEWLAARHLAAQAELDAAVVRDREARRAVDVYAMGIRDLARQNVDVQLEAYDLGRTPLTDLLAEQRRYLDVETSYTTVLERAYDAQVALRRARGETR